MKNRINALETCGVIQGYHADIRLQRSSQTMNFILNVETTAESFEEMKEILREAKETQTVIQTTGRCHLLAVCSTSAPEEMRRFVCRIYGEKGILSIHSHAILDEIKGSIVK